MNPQLDSCFFFSHVSGQIKNAVAQVPLPTPALRRGHADLGPPCAGALSTGSLAWPGRVCEDGRGLWDYPWSSKVIDGKPFDPIYCMVIVNLCFILLLNQSTNW